MASEERTPPPATSHGRIQAARVVAVFPRSHSCVANSRPLSHNESSILPLMPIRASQSPRTDTQALSTTHKNSLSSPRATFSGQSRPPLWRRTKAIRPAIRERANLHFKTKEEQDGYQQKTY